MQGSAFSSRPANESVEGLISTNSERPVSATEETCQESNLETKAQRGLPLKPNQILFSPKRLELTLSK